MAIELMPYDPADVMKTAEDVKHFLTFAFEDSEPDYIAHVVAIAARSEGMAEIADKLGLTHADLCQSLIRDGNPSLTMLVTVLDAVGVKLSIEAKQVTTKRAAAKTRRQA